MNWIVFCLLLATDVQPQGKVDKQTDSTATEANSEQPVSTIQPDKELLLFLAEWNETQDGQWIEPSAFTEDSVLTQNINPQDNQHTGNNHENNPDHF